MLLLIEILIFAAIASLVYFLMANKKNKPASAHLKISPQKEEKLKGEKKLAVFKFFAAINRPLPRAFKESLSYRLAAAKIYISPEEFLLIKELFIIVLAIFLFPVLKQMPAASFFILAAAGYILPDMWLKVRINKFKREITRALPDSIDLLALCVGAGLDFMLAIKWVVEKSARNLLTEELSIVMREINMGKPRKAALVDLSKRYDIAELSTFSRNLIQADRMGTSIAEALNILSEDMRLARFRRGEQQALKAPIKMLIPLLFFIFPVVWVIVGGPILLQFMSTKIGF